jgi:hypothetical protein
MGCLEIARAWGKEHHFRVIQCPLNLLESDPACVREESGRTLLECAAEGGLGVLVNRPLNALVDGRLVRLADVSPTAGAEVSAALALEQLAAHESRFSEQFDFPLMGGGRGAASWLSPLQAELPSLEEFRAVITQAFTPAANTWLLNADASLNNDPRYAGWRRGFAERLDLVISALQRETAKTLDRRTQVVKDSLAKAGFRAPEHTLSQAALAVIMNLPGVSCVLNGMRTPNYVLDSLGAVGLKVADASSVLERLRSDPGLARV